MDKSFGEPVLLEIFKHLMFDPVPEIFRNNFMDTVVAENSKFFASHCKLDQHPVPELGFIHTKLFEQKGGTVKHIPFQGVLKMNPDLAGSHMLRFGNSCGYCLLLFGAEKIPGCFAHDCMI